MKHNEELVKSLTSLIDETLEEIEEIKKSKFSASEIKIEGPGQGIAGKPVNGSLEAKKKEDEEKDEDDSEDHEEDESASDEKDEHKKKKMFGKGENEKADPDHGKFAVAKKEDEDSKEDEEEDKDDKKDMKKQFKKSVEESESLIKSYVDSRLSSFEEKLSKMTAAIEAMADAPVARRSIPAGVRPLSKSNDEHSTPLSKSDVANQLFELKKSGVEVSSTDIFKVEAAKNINEIYEIASKYGLK